jgi:glycosyltransferase involved in cell wall biosynthesis
VKISVIIPAFNEELVLGASLARVRAALAAFDDLGWTSELIVCDNNSTDRTAAIARDAGATVVFEPHNQIARARNIGAAAASGDWLIFVDADSYPSVDLLQEVARIIREGHAIAAGSTVALPGAGRGARAVVGVWNAISRLTHWAAGSFIVCEAAVFHAVGGFSEEFYAGEEIDLFRRLKRYARQRRRSIVIVHQHPVATSDRKAHLYAWHELAFFTLRTVIGGGRTLRNPAACYTWYDGRR